MAGDPLFHDERQFKRMADNPQIVAQFRRLQWVKLAIGFAALALLGAIWLTWRMG